MTRTEAETLFHKYNKSESLYHHALAVEATMRKFAEKSGEDQDFWGMVGFLHDIDWEMYPEQHCKKAPELLAEINATPELIHAVCSHGYGLVTDIKPEKYMEKVLYTIDELTGLITATALMRPEKLKGITIKSIKKKWKDKSFAAGVNRELIQKGAEMLGMELNDIIQTTIDGMTEIALKLGLWTEN